MYAKGSCLMIALLAAAIAPASAQARPPVAGKAKANEAATARHYAALIAGAPQTAGLTLFFSQMPKGADLHHHYSGSIYAETYVDWLDKQGVCVDKTTYRIVADKAQVAAERAKPIGERTCLGTVEVLADDYTYRELLQRWSSKDFDNHGALQPPPDRQFFQTFLYFGAVSNANYNEGLQELKKRAVLENVGYIETMFKLTPFLVNADFDKAVSKYDQQAKAQPNAELDAVLQGWFATLDNDAAFNGRIADYLERIKQAHAGIDDEQFTMRYQAYVLRLLGPSQVFSSMVAGFKAARNNELVVGLNIVGQESNSVSMRDYALHMQMFRFLKAKYPEVKLALHAGELALGDVPPEGLMFHIDQALNVAGANRIGHGLDLAHESNAIGIMKTMRDKDVPVEINLTSNSFISGVKGDNHPLTLYRHYAVPYVISTDDAGVTRHNLANEYTLFASRYKPNYAEIKKASYNSLRYSFLPAAHKQRLTKQLDARYATFEAAIAGLQAAQAKRTTGR